MSLNTLECIEIETGSNPQRAVIWLHGLGADGNDFAPVVPEFKLDDFPAIRFIFPHAPVQPVTINNGMAMRAWYDIFTPDLVQREDEAGLRSSEAAVRALIAQENVRGIPSSSIVLAGFSQGSALTLQTGLRLDERVAGMVGLSGYLPLLDKVKNERHTANHNTPIFMGHGTMDPVVAIERGKKSRDLLIELGYSVTWKTYPMPHSVCLEEINDVAAFLRQVLA